MVKKSNRRGKKRKKEEKIGFVGTCPGIEPVTYRSQVQFQDKYPRSHISDTAREIQNKMAAGPVQKQTKTK